MAFEFIVPPGHPSSVPVAEMAVVCSVHEHDEPIATYCLAQDGGEFVRTTPGFRSEYVNDEQLPAAVLEKFASPGDLPLDAPAGVDPSTPPHFRHRFTCPRPSCKFNAAVRCDGDDGMWRRTTDMLHGMREASIERMTIAGVDGAWRVVSQA